MAKRKPEPEPEDRMPAIISVKGKRFRTTLCLIHSYRPGTSMPALVTILPDEHQIELEGSERFLVVYIAEDILDADKEQQKEEET